MVHKEDIVSAFLDLCHRVNRRGLIGFSPLRQRKLLPEQEAYLARKLGPMLADPNATAVSIGLFYREEEIRAIRSARAREALRRIRDKAKADGLDHLTMDEIDAIIASMGAQLKVSDNPWMPFDDYYSREDFSFIRLETLDESADEALTLIAELIGE